MSNMGIISLVSNVRVELVRIVKVAQMLTAGVGIISNFFDRVVLISNLYGKGLPLVRPSFFDKVGLRPTQYW